MIAWILSLFGGLALRTKLYGFLILTGLAILLGFWLRLRLALRQARTAQDKAAKLEATRVLEQRIAAGQQSLKARQAKVREQILSRKGERDYFQ